MSPRQLSVTITGPEGMLEAMAKLLRDEGYTVTAPGRDEPETGAAPAPWTAVDLHEALDLLFAQYQLDNRELRTGISVLDLLTWSRVRIDKARGLKRAKAKASR